MDISIYNGLTLVSLSNALPESVGELGIFGAILVLIAILYKLISAIQIVIDILTAVITKKTLPVLIAIISVSVPIGFSGSNYVFFSEPRYQILQNSVVLFLMYIFLMDIAVAFLLSKRAELKKYCVFIGTLLATLLISANKYNHLYILFSSLLFLISAIQYRRLDSTDQKRYCGTVYLRIILATSFALGISIFANLISNMHRVEFANMTLAIAVMVIMEFEFYNKVMEEIEYL